MSKLTSVIAGALAIAAFAAPTAQAAEIDKNPCTATGGLINASGLFDDVSMYVDPTIVDALNTVCDTVDYEGGTLCAKVGAAGQKYLGHLFDDVRIVVDPTVEAALATACSTAP